ncbi:MAG: transglutaminase family protein [Bacteroidota bacterium]|nr:transglutaminase family protein [Bacteroidota bacterium]
MKSDKLKQGYKGLLLAGCLGIGIIPALAQPATELAQYQAKYPKEQIIGLQDKCEVTITQDKKSGVPQIRMKESSVEMILEESASLYTESKEFFNGKTEIKKLEAYSLIPEQEKFRKVPVSKFVKTTESDYTYFDDVYCYNFNFPAPGKGGKRCKNSEVEIKDPNYPLWFYFDSSYPVEQAEFSVTFPASVKITYHLFGEDTTRIRFSQSTKGDEITYRWTSTCPKGYDHDHLAPNIRYYVPQIVVQIAESEFKGKTTRHVRTLDDLYKVEYANISKLNLTESPEVKAIADSITAGIQSPREKVRAIFKWVQNNIRYIAIEDGSNGLVPREAALVLSRRYGDCKDKSSLLTAMLRAIGQPASLAWLGTRHLPYKYSEYPTISAGNHMIAVWWNEQNQPVLLDGTTQYLRMEDVPSAIQGKECIISKNEKEYQLYRIPFCEPSVNTVNDTIHLRVENGMLKGSGISVFDGEKKSEIIARFARTEKEKYSTLWEDVFAKPSDKFTITRIETSDLKEIDQPLKIRFEFQIPDYITTGNNSSYLNMNIEKSLNNIELKKDRKMPIEFEMPMKHNLVCILDIPKQVKVTDVPNATTYDSPKFSYTQKYEKQGNRIVMSSTHIYNQLLLKGNDIAEFYKMVNLMKQAYRNTIILEKN